MRDYKNIDKYLDKLIEDIYPQPEDEGHTTLARQAIDTILSKANGIRNVLDVGCGEAFCQPVFEGRGVEYKGVCLGKDFEVAKSRGRSVYNQDFSFLEFADNSFDAVFSRHSLEHSPFPLLTITEWNRVSRKYVAVILPAVEHWRYGGRNHYFVLNRRQWKVLFDVAGLEVVYEDVKRKNMKPDNTPPDVAIEYWFLLKKKEKSDEN